MVTVDNTKEASSKTKSKARDVLRGKTVDNTMECGWAGNSTGLECM